MDTIGRSNTEIEWFDNNFSWTCWYKTKFGVEKLKRIYSLAGKIIHNSLIIGDIGCYLGSSDKNPYIFQYLVRLPVRNMVSATAQQAASERILALGGSVMISTTDRTIQRMQGI